MKIKIFILQFSLLFQNCPCHNQTTEIVVCRNQIAVLLQEYRRVLPAIYRYISSDDVETPNLHVTKNLNISKTKQDIEELKMPLRLVWKRCSVAFKIG